MHDEGMTMSLEFWQEKPATVDGMVLVDDCDILDRAERADILAQLPPLEGMDILELGAGIGRYTSHFVQVARHVIAVDFVEKFIEENRRATAHFSNAVYCCADVMNLDDLQIILLRDRIHRWTRVGGKVFLRESCFVGSMGTAPSKDNPTRYRSDEEYTRLFENDFSLLHRGNVKIYEERFNNPHQYYWLFQR